MAKSKSFLKNRKLIIILILVVVGVYLYLNYDHKVTHRIEIQDNYANNGKKLNNSNNSNNAEERELRKELLKAQIEATKVQTQRDISHAVYDKAYDRIINPLTPPEKSYEAVYGVPINVPTRGATGGYQQVGYLYRSEVSDPDKQIGNNSDNAIIPLYGHRLFNGSDKWNYYVSSDKYHSIKMPIMHKNRKCDSEFGCNEIYNDDEIDVPAYNSRFKVQIYEFDKPRYLPNVLYTVT